ncbi:M20 family metallopeptidase [Clostridium sp. DMHC 10]|uniref:M20 metallopeptidase family protein n=1 Tax=Clostridium sp. DMHC 10 TaxID=747377 RepID=UPI000A4499F3|nr:M20 family metallopeptidase [Clostridium sp. DMHC 10]
MENSTLNLAKNIQNWLIKYRREFHKHPEPSFEEVWTSKTISDELERLGLEVQRIGKTGVIGILRGKLEGKTIGLRADIDALSVTEDTGYSFASENKGYMHACGHDSHITMLLGAAKLLSEMKDKLNGTVKFIFQPAEELALGAKSMIDGGALENPHVDYIFGMHIWSDVPVGQAVIQSGPFMASADIWDLTIKGKSCHGSSPWQGVDAITCSAAVIQGVQTLVSRVNDARNPIVMNIGTIEGGERFNVTPGSVKMSGMNRSFSKYSREQMPKWVENMVENVCKGYNCDYDFKYDFTCAATINEEKATGMLKSAVAKLIGEDNIKQVSMIMGSEDFSEYLEKSPRCINAFRL